METQLREEEAMSSGSTMKVATLTLPAPTQLQSMTGERRKDRETHLATRTGNKKKLWGSPFQEHPQFEKKKQKNKTLKNFNS